MRSEGITSMLVMEIPHGTKNMGSGIEESVADGVIQLEHSEDNTSPIILRVFKMRGTSINREPHICTISKNGGMILYPKQSLRLTYVASEERISSGIPGFDERIGNGLIRGTTTAIIGPTGYCKINFCFSIYSRRGNKKRRDWNILLTRRYC